MKLVIKFSRSVSTRTSTSIQGYTEYLVPDDDSFVHVDVDEVRASAAVGLPVRFGVLVGQFVCSMVIGRNFNFLPALILLQLHTGT